MQLMNIMRWGVASTMKVVIAVAFTLCFSFAAWAGEWRVEAVPTAKTLLLENGQVVRLAAIQAPNRARHAQERNDTLAEQAHRWLEAQVRGDRVRVEAVSRTPDRHGRIVARVYDGEGRLLQAELLRAGMGWAYTFPDTRDMAAELLAAEREAEAAQRGVWAEPDYAVLEPDDAMPYRGEFRLVEGDVRSVNESKGRYYLNFGEDWKTDFTLMVSARDARRFEEGWLMGLAGKRVRVRGWLFRMNGPAMELTHPEQLEVIIMKKNQ